LRPCEFEIAAVTSFLTTSSRRSASSSESPRFFNSMMVTSFSVSSTATEIAATRPPVIPRTVDSMSSG
jgi:hypothetical protein